MKNIAYASPATYGAAPTMTSMYATPGASMYMPAGQASAYGQAGIQKKSNVTFRQK